jgi:hypothetical protein
LAPRRAQSSFAAQMALLHQGLSTCSIVALTCLGLAAGLHGQNPPPRDRTADTHRNGAPDLRYRYRLLGVYDEETGAPIEGVEVSDVVSGMSALTTKTGTVSLFFLPDSGSLVKLRKVGYGIQTLFVRISPADTSPVTVVLPRAVSLPTVTTRDFAPRYLSPVLRDAQARIRSHPGGYFIDETEMRKWDNSTLGSAILSHMPGLTASTGPHGEMYLLSTHSTCKFALSCGRPDCYVTVYRDGVRFFDPGTPGGVRVDVSRLSPSDYEIAEFYPGSASQPVEYAGASCGGVLLLWSRER